MRTEQLLRDTLADVADRARTPEVTLSRVLGRLPDRIPRRRRRLLLAGVVAVVLALAVAVPTFLVDRAAEPVGRVPGNWNLTHRVELPPGWEVTQQSVSADSETTGLRTIDDSGESCLIDVGGPGRPDLTASQADRTPVVVRGQPGWYASDRSGAYGLAGVSWEYQPDAFVLVSCGGRTADLAMAERVRFEPVPVRLPFRVRSLPSGYRAQVVMPPLTTSTESVTGAAQFRATDEQREPRTFAIAILPGSTEIPPGVAGWETDTVAGRSAVLSARDARLCLNLQRHTACVEATVGDPEDLTRSLWAAGRRDLLVDVAERLVLADDLDDPGTWFPANRALPR